MTAPTPEHVSYSQLSDFVKCGKRYQLSRVLGLEGPQWLAGAGGKAVHAATEDFDRALFAQTGR